MNERLASTRILQIHNRYRQSGGEDVVVDAHRNLLEGAGYGVYRFEMTNPEGGLASAMSLAMAPWNPLSAFRLRTKLRDSHPHVAHVHNTWFAISPSVINILAAEGVPTVMTLHNYRLTCINAQLLRDGQPCQVCVGRGPWMGVRYRCYRDSYVASAAAAASLSLNRRLETYESGVDTFLVFTSFQRDLMTDAGLPSDKVEIVPNFVADPGPRLNRPGESDTLLFVGRLSPEKGIDRLIAAWERLEPRGLRLVVIGDGPLLHSLAARDVPGVEFKGHVPGDNVRASMLRARALLYPSILYEGQPMVLLEALASALPVVASNIGGVAATLGDAAIFTEETEWDDALAATFTLGDTDLVSLSDAARQRYLKEFTPAGTLEKLENVYSTILTAEKARR